MMGLLFQWTVNTVSINKRAFYICILYLLNGMYPVQPDDPCLTARRLPDTPYSRSSIPAPNPSQIYLCDVGQFTADEWVRFDRNGSEAFTFHIPETCVTGPRCGTEAPIWMNGKHPTKDNPGPVSARSCLAIISDDCCDWNQTMQVKYCSPGYFVYQLQPPTGCSSSYCFDDVPTSRLNFYPDMGTSRLECVNGGSVAQVRCYVDGASTNIYARYEARLVVNFDTTDYIAMGNTRHDVVFNLTITNNTKQIKCYTRSYWSFDLSHASGDLQSNTIFTCPVTTTTTTTLPTTTTIATTTTTTTLPTTTTMATTTTTTLSTTTTITTTPTIPTKTTTPITTEITTTTTTITTTATTTTTTIKTTAIMSTTTTTTLSSTKTTTTTTLATTQTTSTPTTVTPLYLTNSISSSISTTFLASLPTTTTTIKASTTSVLPEPAHSASTVPVTTTTHKDEPENSIHIALPVALPLSAIAIGVLILVVLKCCGRYRCTNLYKKMRPASLRSESSTDSSKYLDNSGGSRDNSGGSVENSGGSRENSGGSRDKYGVYIDTDAISPQRLPQSTQNESGYEPLRTNQQDGSLMSKNSKTTDKNSSHHYSTIMSQNSFTSERQPNYQNPPLIY